MFCTKSTRAEERCTESKYAVQTFLSKRRLKRDLAKDIVEVFYEKINSQHNTERVFDSLSSSLQVCMTCIQLFFTIHS
jgi:hypothetical protein